MKQFEHAIQKIASEVQSLDRTRTARAISHLEETIDALHGKLVVVDREIGEWARRNLARITLETEETDPRDAASEVVGTPNGSNGFLTSSALGRSCAAVLRCGRGPAAGSQARSSARYPLP